MSLRETEKLAQQDVLMDGTCSEGEMSAVMTGLRLAPGSDGETFAELVGVSRLEGRIMSSGLDLLSLQCL